MAKKLWLASYDIKTGELEGKGASHGKDEHYFVLFWTNAGPVRADGYNRLAAGRWRILQLEIDDEE